MSEQVNIVFLNVYYCQGSFLSNTFISYARILALRYNYFGRV